MAGSGTWGRCGVTGRLCSKSWTMGGTLGGAQGGAETSPRAGGRAPAAERIPRRPEYDEARRPGDAGLLAPGGARCSGPDGRTPPGSGASRRETFRCRSWPSAHHQFVTIDLVLRRLRPHRPAPRHLPPASGGFEPRGFPSLRRGAVPGPLAGDYDSLAVHPHRQLLRRQGDGRPESLELARRPRHGFVRVARGALERLPTARPEGATRLARCFSAGFRRFPFPPAPKAAVALFASQEFASSPISRPPIWCLADRAARAAPPERWTRDGWLVCRRSFPPGRVYGVRRQVIGKSSAIQRQQTSQVPQALARPFWICIGGNCPL